MNNDTNSGNHYPEIEQLVIGLTGGIGSGKTVVSDWFSEQGVTIIDADVIAREIVAKESPTLQKLINKFGEWVVTETGELNRALLRKHIFKDSNALVDLEEITHPAIREQACLQLQASTSDYTIVSAPLLLEASEAGLAGLCQRIVVVDVPEELQIVRASQRDGQTVENIKSIMKNQMSREERIQRADDVILNNETLVELYEKLHALHSKYMLMAN